MSEYHLTDNLEEATKLLASAVRDYLAKKSGEVYIHVFVHDEKAERDWQEVRGGDEETRS